MRASLTALAVATFILLLMASRGGAQSWHDIPAASHTTTGPIVAELFTSQSCSSCPPAEKLFSQLADRGDLVILEWHVDYWDRLVHGRAGAWKDPYSDAAFTARQRQYNRTLRNTAGVYTPQAVINGRSETVGSRRNEVERLLTEDAAQTVNIEIESVGTTLTANIGALRQPLTRAAQIYRLTLLPSQTTSVPRGENRGAILSSRNIVLAIDEIGTYSGDAQKLSVSPPEEDQSCAIIVQEKRGNRLGPILAASYC